MSFGVFFFKSSLLIEDVTISRFGKNYATCRATKVSKDYAIIRITKVSKDCVSLRDTKLASVKTMFA